MLFVLCMYSLATVDQVKGHNMVAFVLQPNRWFPCEQAKELHMVLFVLQSSSLVPVDKVMGQNMVISDCSSSEGTEHGAICPVFLRVTD